MNLHYLHYSAAFKCAYPAQTAVQAITEASANPNSPFKIIRTDSSGSCEMILTFDTGSLVYFNSFLPEAAVQICDTQSGSLLSLTFRLKKSVKRILFIVSFCALILTISLFARFIKDQMMIVPPICILLAIWLFLFSAPILGLKHTSKKALIFLYETLTAASDRSCYPILRKGK